MQRGILATSYAKLTPGTDEAKIRRVYEQYYKNEKFVPLLEEGVFPETRFTKCSNYLDINFKTEPRTGRLIVVSALDNLIKGAAGQAVQNMNILFGLPESTGLETVPVIV